VRSLAGHLELLLLLLLLLLRGQQLTGAAALQVQLLQPLVLLLWQLHSPVAFLAVALLLLLLLVPALGAACSAAPSLLPASPFCRSLR
jgi:hypothetical protein